MATSKPLSAGDLRHRVQIQSQIEINDPDTNAVTIDWAPFGGPVWAAIAPLSAKEFIQSASEQNKIVARITIRYRDGILPSMRVIHRGTIYNITGVLADADSGLEYQTLVVSTGVNDGQ